MEMGGNHGEAYDKQGGLRFFKQGEPTKTGRFFCGLSLKIIVVGYPAWNPNGPAMGRGPCHVNG